MTRRDFARHCSLMTLPLAARAAAARPNIVLMLADDLGYSDLGCFGGEIETPNLDALAHGGVRFSQFYNAGRCCPSRASLLTGLYSHQAGMGHMTNDLGVPAYHGALNRNCATLGEALRAGAGYHTALAGKWHAGSKPEEWPGKRGFDRFYGTLESGSYFHPTNLAEGDARLPVPQSDFYLTSAVAESAARFIREAPADRPFFLYVGFPAPHFPLQALPEDLKRQRGKYASGWDRLRELRHRRMTALGMLPKGSRLSPRDPTVAEWKDLPDKEAAERQMETYAAQVTRLDAEAGRVLEALRQSGRESNTLVLFLSDNGGCAEMVDRDSSGERWTSYHRGWSNLSNTPFRMHKHWVHEGGISTPLIVRWPARVKPSREWQRTPGHIVDIMPTLLEAAGAAYPKELGGYAIPPMEGQSLLPLLDRRGEGRPRKLFWEHEGNRAIRSGDWKLVSAFEQPWELHHLAEDRNELHNRIADRPPLARELESMWDAWAKRCGVMPWTRELENRIGVHRREENRE
ncbi:MAG: arylsulfatase [Bryobacterales bacterium]|nr:arylsulfatase [Bryobacterales bacterium]